MKVAVIGPGTMGSGIAQAFAQVEGYEVVLVHYARLERAQQGIDGIVKGLQKRVDRGKMEQAAADAIAVRLKPGLYEDCADADLIIESASEDMATKKDTFAKLDQIAKPECLFTTNTSSLSISELASGIDHALVGMHFFNPAPVMKLVEVIPGLNTPEELVEKVTAIAQAIGKTPVLVQEGPGFVVNRILVPMINEAIGILADGLASPEGIDTAMKLGAAHPMGPLELGDLVGLDVCLAIMEVLQAETGDPKYRPHPMLRKMVRGGKLGRKSGEGFYKY
ncbi:MAG: 3-hydroxybutyryl-CoA dehydrogenase [Chloroflexi bacterium]|nr:3-hydroxybutyryl-CoA dehydrogenase [Chloroflexota bacterium]